jgi:hypothetical protein
VLRGYDSERMQINVMLVCTLSVTFFNIAFEVWYLYIIGDRFLWKPSVNTSHKSGLY